MMQLWEGTLCVTSCMAKCMLTSKWFLIPCALVRSVFAIAVINETLTTIGGYGHDMQVTNKLCNLTGTGGGGEKTWIKQFLPCQLTLP